MIFTRVFVLCVIGSGVSLAAQTASTPSPLEALVSAAGKACLPAGLKNLPAPPGSKPGTSQCVSQVWLEKIPSAAARDFYRELLQKEGWDVANPYNEAENFRFTATKKQQSIQFDFYALQQGGGTRLEITHAVAQPQASLQPKS